MRCSLRDSQVLSHPWVIGELALSQLSCRSEIIGLLQNAANAPTATDAEVLTLIENQHLFGLGVGYGGRAGAGRDLADAAGAALWKRDKRLAAVAARLGLAESPVPKT